jgi:predicted transcriptional regulator
VVNNQSKSQVEPEIQAEPEIQETSILQFIAKNLAVPLLDITGHFQASEEKVQGKLQPLVSYGFVREPRPGYYSITANGIKMLEHSVKTGLAAYF